MRCENSIGPAAGFVTPVEPSPLRRTDRQVSAATGQRRGGRPAGMRMSWLAFRRARPYKARFIRAARPGETPGACPTAPFQ
ncbi:conserved hypothetical protein [Rhodospirillum centenum SW]|uniref:Uncharacterized protein n=1 Tax=Rhodospirillum centenum (strain ATCC 51521 / SW) TaxID=414684 RepID=B6IPJ6_RHOCS|nr:conserved hypothetical protein [Rhodospirillum centenum SW]